MRRRKPRTEPRLFSLPSLVSLLSLRPLEAVDDVIVRSLSDDVSLRTSPVDMGRCCG